DALSRWEGGRVDAKRNGDQSRRRDNPVGERRGGFGRRQGDQTVGDPPQRALDLEVHVAAEGAAGVEEGVAVGGVDDFGFWIADFGLPPTPPQEGGGAGEGAGNRRVGVNDRVAAGA